MRGARAELDRIKQCRDPEIRMQAAAHLAEEVIQSCAKFNDELLEAADRSEFELADEIREELLKGIALAVDRPAWYQPGARIVLPDSGFTREALRGLFDHIADNADELHCEALIPLGRALRRLSG